MSANARAKGPRSGNPEPLDRRRLLLAAAGLAMARTYLGEDFFGGSGEGGATQPAVQVSEVGAVENLLTLGRARQPDPPGCYNFR